MALEFWVIRSKNGLRQSEKSPAVPKTTGLKRTGLEYVAYCGVAGPAQRMRWSWSM